VVHSKFKRRVALAVVILATAAFAGGAYAASQESPTSVRQAFLNDVAKRLHVTPAQVTTALKGAAVDQIDAAVAAGKLTQAQANALKQRVQQGQGLALFGGGFLLGQGGGPSGAMGMRFHAPGAMGMRFHAPGAPWPSAPGAPWPSAPGAPGRASPGKAAPGKAAPGKAAPGTAAPNAKRIPGNGVPGYLFRAPGIDVPGYLFRAPRMARPVAGPFAGPLAGAASYLGLTGPQLFKDLASGKTLAQIATARGKTVAGLKAAMYASIKARLDKAVGAKAITSARERQLLSRFSDAIGREITQSFKRPAFPRAGSHGPVYPGTVPVAPGWHA
jgi:hypothetical protein